MLLHALRELKEAEIVDCINAVDFEGNSMLLHTLRELKEAELIDCIYGHGVGEEKETMPVCYTNNIISSFDVQELFMIARIKEGRQDRHRKERRIRHHCMPASIIAD